MSSTRPRCADWTTSAEIDSTGTDTSTFAAGLVTSAIEWASDWMHEKTFGRWPGACIQETLRPCGHASHCTYITSWRPCQCSGGDILRLPRGPVVSVDLVQELGVVLTEGTDYRVNLGKGWVTRANSRSWPGCNDPSDAPTSIHAWFVTYTWGEAPPALGRLAASQLAGEFLNQVVGSDACVLPPNTISAQGLGLTIQLDAEEVARALFAVGAFFDAYPSRPLARIGYPGVNAEFVEDDVIV